MPCTDNTSISAVTLTEEYELLQDAPFNFTPADYMQVIFNGFSSAFLEPALRRRMVSEAMAETYKIFTRAGFDVEAKARELERLDFVGVEFGSLLTKQPYWRGHENPALTLEVVTMLPKADDEIGLNLKKLKEGFKQIYGDSVFSFLFDYKMEVARKLLEAGDDNVNEVGHKVGYSTSSHFIAAFKKKYGTTPKKYIMSLN